MTSELGPTKMSPALRQASAKSGFSERNPTLGGPRRPRIGSDPQDLIDVPGKQPIGLAGFTNAVALVGLEAMERKADPRSE